MIKKIAIIAATKQEIVPLQKILKKQNVLFKHIEFYFFYTGVGAMIATFKLTQLLSKKNFNAVFQVGIGGSFTKEIELGKAVIINKEYMADVGVLDNKIWNDFFDLGFANNNKIPFTKKAIENKYQKKLKKFSHQFATGITVNTITTNPNIKKQFIQKYTAQIESMEGAALHYVCSQFKTPFVQIRGVSNVVGERNKKNWKIQEAIESSNTLALEVISCFK